MKYFSNKIPKKVIRSYFSILTNLRRAVLRGDGKFGELKCKEIVPALEFMECYYESMVAGYLPKASFYEIESFLSSYFNKNFEVYGMVFPVTFDEYFYLMAQKIRNYEKT